LKYLVNFAMSLPPAPSPRRAATGYNLAAIATLVLLAGVGAAYVIVEMGPDEHPVLSALSDGNPVVQTLAGRELVIPANRFRVGEPRDGFTNQVDLRVSLPSSVGPHNPVDITLLPRNRARASAALLDAVYLHQFSEETRNGVAGLVGKPMRGGEGYAGETVWYDPLSANPFVAKCLDPVLPGTPAQCVRTVYLASGVAAVYRFDATTLQSWRQFDVEMARWLTPIGAW
jgi:hypothetical protein